MGAYKKGTNARIDEAINKIDKINNFLRQEIMQSFNYQQALKNMAEALK